MKQNEASALVVAGGLILFGVIAWLKGLLGVDFQVASQFLTAVIVAIALCGAAWWVCSYTGAPYPWQFIPALAWWTLWPVLRAKGTNMPTYFIERGIDPQYRWFAATEFRWGVAFVLVVVASLLYAKRWNDYR